MSSVSACKANYDACVRKMLSAMPPGASVFMDEDPNMTPKLSALMDATRKAGQDLYMAEYLERMAVAHVTRTLAVMTM
jgi:hypothetical protein